MSSWAFRRRGVLSCFGRGRSGSVGRLRRLEEGVGYAEYVVEILARAEVAVDDGVAARGILEGIEPE